MAEIPDAMMRKGRGADGSFNSGELLFRRVPLTLWEDGDDAIEIDAIELPDMSVLRSKYGHAEWARLERDDFAEWGVVSFAVENIPEELLHEGIFRWEFGPHHDPLHKNFPHTEVRAFENKVHVNMKLKDRLDPQLHLRWREQLLRKVRKEILPYEEREVPQDAP